MGNKGKHTPTVTIYQLSLATGEMLAAYCSNQVLSPSKRWLESDRLTISGMKEGRHFEQTSHMSSSSSKSGLRCTQSYTSSTVRES
ncbi:hypothetical protein CERZMDRAFT_122115 [Cercospora zeae-maydis SCOH1-5]|uniref:Uncharacterized protein n=1 Tax=Cercospora zeae-maydis SCOH1-5 TaxID=717836 RepID=A0A6A6F7X3_9PEZI|nr:hypothetical protein CERZMDRAFT_122115 [Cercospora zeae-maydis SCOH1-5]